LRVLPPTTEVGIERYLASGLIRGIGPAYAKRLVKAFGTEVFSVIEATPAKLREIEGIGEVRAKRIVEGWADQRVIRDIMVFLHANGVSTSRAVRIFKTYGQNAIDLVKENPYRLARDIKGIGFVSADTIARNMGIESTSILRARGGISHALMDAIGDGHCGLPRKDLIPLAVKLLEIPEAIIEEALSLEIAEGTVIEDTLDEEPAVFLATLYRAERAIATRLMALCKGATPWPPIDADKAIAWVQEKLAVQLSESQHEAVRLALQSKVLVITGGPGVGKTTLSSRSSPSWAPSVSGFPFARPPAGPRSVCPKAPGWKPRRFTACWKSIREAGASPGARTTPSTATCWSRTSARWSMCRS
jgi:exodeoxyribonuclease V alpha subunit